jgi:RNA polymerase sigma factor (sigma-70 family)
VENDILTLTDSELDARCHPVALATARALLRDLPVEDAEECANDVMLRLLSRREEYDPARGSLETYVRVMARSAALDRRRRKGPEVLPLAEEIYLTGGQEEYIGDIVEEVLALLELRERKLFTLRFLYGFSAAEAAARLGMTRGGVDVATLRLRRKLRRMLESRGIQVEAPGKAKRGRAPQRREAQ